MTYEDEPEMIPSPRAQKIIDDFLMAHPGADFGPAHIVVADYNLEDGHILHCINNLFRPDPEHSHLDVRANKDLFNATLKVLLDLAEIPEEEREIPWGEVET